MSVYSMLSVKRIYRIVITISVLLVCAFVFSSCIINESDFLLYQKYPFSVTADISIDSAKFSIKAELTGPFSGSITYLSPDTIKDIVFSSGPDGVFISYDNLRIPVTPKSDADFLILLYMFSLDTSQFSGVEIIDGISGKLNLVTFKTDIGPVNVYIDPVSGMPVKFSAELYNRSVDVVITGFEFG